ENSVQFIVYNAQGDRVNTAKLDSKGDNMSVPTNCLVCHGGSFTPDTDQVARQAHFLPFDVFRLKYADDLGIDAPEYTYNAQAEKFRKLNEHVYNAGATDDIKGMIDSMYGGPGKVSIANTPAQEYVPESWQQAGKAKVYNAVVKPYCRTCHVAREEAPGFIWEKYENFNDNVGSMPHLVCETHDMPNAEQTLKNFWKSSARAHLAGAFPNAGASSGASWGACTP